LERVSETDLPIIYAQKWAFYDDATIDYEFGTEENLPPKKGSFAKLQLGLEKTLETLIARGHRVLLIGGQVFASCAINRPRLLQGPLPHAPQPPCPTRTRKEAEQFTTSTDQMLSRIQAKWPDKVELLRPADYFCDKDCPVIEDGVWLYFDYAHFSVAGSRYMVTRASDAFRKFLKS
jgi:hypothetical protein